ncbi:HNH endonuclease [Acidovorax delafieldii]|uniref:HNH endonuclease n=1 Tax=Acidovorax delafieldii TaxID=47920 RepID=UPI003F501869
MCAQGATGFHPRSCTAEHLQAKRDGGVDMPQNIVAACRYCNEARHAKYGGLTPRKFRREVQKQAVLGKWITHRVTLARSRR